MKKKIAIVTGASGGLGKELLKQMLQEDVDEIWAVSRNREKLENIRNQYGKKIIPIAKDLSVQEEIYTFVDILKTEQPVIAYLVNNAGVGKMGSYKDFTLAEVQTSINLSCNAVVSLCMICIPYMGSGSRIINMSSQSAFQPVPYLNLYAATRAFIRSYTRALNVELSDAGIIATTVCPGWVDTELLMKEISGIKTKFPALVSADKVACQAIKDAKKGKDMSVCTLYVKYMHFLSKIWPQRMIMKAWTRSIQKYL